MSTQEQSVEFSNENIENVVKKVIRKENVKDFKINLVSGSAKGDNYLGVIQRAIVNGFKEDGQPVQMKLILKIPPGYPRDKFPMDTAYKREVIAYTELFPRFEELQMKHGVKEGDRLKYVKCLGTDLTYMKEVIVMEDLNVAGFVMADRQKSLDIDQLTLVMKSLSMFHALSFALKKEDMGKFQYFSEHCALVEDMGEGFDLAVEMYKQKAIEALDNEVDKQRLIDFKAYESFNKLAFSSTNVPFTVLSHGDCWTNNMLFRYEVVEMTLEYPNQTFKDLVSKIVREESIQEPKVTITSATNKGDNYLGLIYRVNVEGSNKELKLVFKSAPSYARDKFPIDKVYKREIFAYTDILPELENLQIIHGVPSSEKINHIKFFGADNAYLAEVIALQDMNSFGFKMANRRESLDFEHMKLVVKSLAALHSSSFCLKKNSPDVFIRFAEEIYDDFEYREMFKIHFDIAINRAVDALEEGSHRDKFSQFSNMAFDKFFKWIEGNDYLPYTVLCHGDCWTNNMLFKYENDKPVEVRLLDWQMIKHSSPVVDIAYLIFSSTDEELRAKYYERLLEIYYETLKSNLAKLDCDVNICYPEPIFKKHIKEIMPFGLIMAFLTAPMFMSEDDDIPDMDELLKKDKIDKDDMQLKNEKSKHRYEERIRGVVRDFVRLDLI